jgi:hypothetical protein
MRTLFNSFVFGQLDFVSAGYCRVLSMSVGGLAHENLLRRVLGCRGGGGWNIVPKNLKEFIIKVASAKLRLLIVHFNTK